MKFAKKLSLLSVNKFIKHITTKKHTGANDCLGSFPQRIALKYDVIDDAQDLMCSDSEKVR